MAEDTIIYTINPSLKARLKGRLIAKKKTPFQEIVVFESPIFGKMMLIGQDDYFIVQFSLSDEKYYHETVAHPPLSLHPHPSRILIIGGGDGGVLREVLKHPVEKATIAELDQEVISISKEHFPSISNGAFSDPRVEIKIGDGRKFLEETQEKFDVVILDLTDPEGPSKLLFTKEFYELLKSRMNEGGVLSAQTSSYFEPQVLGRVNSALSQVFSNVASYATFVPSFMVLETYTLATDSQIEGIAKTLKERRIKPESSTSGQLESMVLNPHSFVRRTLSKEWLPSIDSNPVEVNSE
ncbi:polyamine aminopropyltransferase [Candidatus Micrarchaeota archaeon]|nr:polyamine aminopropyltransferase [Candidatus Micrarchaeota archaeon]MBD3417856.1 polyamine aminopropyltransferase [Candidatus Micrarchaeota archaeon]